MSEYVLTPYAIFSLWLDAIVIFICGFELHKGIPAPLHNETHVQIVMFFVFVRKNLWWFWEGAGVRCQHHDGICLKTLLRCVNGCEVEIADHRWRWHPVKVRKSHRGSKCFLTSSSEGFDHKKIERFHEITRKNAYTLLILKNWSAKMIKKMDILYCLRNFCMRFFSEFNRKPVDIWLILILITLINTLTLAMFFWRGPTLDPFCSKIENWFPDI